ncbi:hypothetical protein A2Z33_02930 [Candidatus Gottesmanbacteria bacterium RBG_16_52_11]|uniref:Glycosyltransferase RgtA/B/C/D-like domain-containing protein n=1 Tax=Candidatus Gottesmanbacteria bacterium RBG_16_52_11 TaxID=1798374 RepID=A0A1F5YN68_9BACT|nr:MAG: hypothetical protein A2Z33_02930 [Candidatus Gottesmanbacteria bacterium RBG_16_52_11]
MRRFVRQYRVLFFIITTLLALFLVNAFHEEYPDEYDSISGGKFITQLKVPYRDWFQHHQPGAYALAALILPFSGQSFVRFRVFLAVSFFTICIAGFAVIRRRVRQKNHLFYLYLLFSVTLGATYFWGQMLLADTLSAYLILPAYALLIMKVYYGERLEPADIWIICGLAFLTWFTSMTYTFALFGLTAFTVFTYFRQQGRARIRQAIKTVFLAAVLPYTLFFLFFTLTGSLRDYYFANITYNQNFYIYSYPRPPGAPVNPVRLAVVITNDFIREFTAAVMRVQFLPFDQPLPTAFGLSAIALIALFLRKRRVLLALLVLYMAIFVNARSNPGSLKETDYQAAVYIILSLFNGFFALSEISRLLNGKLITSTWRLLLSALLVLTGSFVIASQVFFLNRYLQKFFPKYMGTMPLIYDRPQIAPYVNAITSKGDYAYIGPFEFKEVFYLENARMPSRFHWFLDHAARSKIKDELIADLSKNRPKVIVFKRKYAPWGGNASDYNKFFTDFLDANYFRIFELNDGGKSDIYRWKIANTQDFDIDGDFNFDKNRKEEIIRNLIEAGLIERTSESV